MPDEKEIDDMLKNKNIKWGHDGIRERHTLAVTATWCYSLGASMCFSFKKQIHLSDMKFSKCDLQHHPLFTQRNCLGDQIQ